LNAMACFHHMLESGSRENRSSRDFFDETSRQKNRDGMAAKPPHKANGTGGTR
jgi:hypothetical protein